MTSQRNGTKIKKKRKEKIIQKRKRVEKIFTKKKKKRGNSKRDLRL